MQVSFSHNNSLVKKPGKNDSQPMDFGDCSAVGGVLSDDNKSFFEPEQKDDPSLEEQINAFQEDSDIFCQKEVEFPNISLIHHDESNTPIINIVDQSIDLLSKEL